MKNFLIAVAVIFLIAGGAYTYLSYKNKDVSSIATTSPATSGKYVGKKILYVDSYYDDYDWSQGLTSGIKSVLDGTGVELKIVRMDTKRNPAEEFKKKAGEDAHLAIEVFKPDVLMVSDDNAFKYIIVPFYKDVALPVVFSGLNWDASLYGAPYANTTGMIEISLTNQIIDHLKTYARGNRIGYLSADTETERKNLEYYGKLLNINFDKSYFVKNMAEWESAFLKLQNETDLVIFENNAGILDWNSTTSAIYALANTKVPMGTTNPWIMDYSLLGITKIPEEQGQWQAEAALKILDGTKPSEIPLVRNKRGNLMVNLKIAKELGVIFNSSILKNAQVIQ
ncbi:MAG: hypothetical protein A2648_00595 [Candidatus Lloydbacteria bacterium RIFCSPHIGHO2_01_FULL_41_20]|uniref:ABC transporter substrate-binding protein n=1 Tax=Candidatus Lloydbacteria bacterium RIFCSPHIGHO2_01_FULL_41_20 TaxID=1798657 RepID=A0A1G2CT27_9BACT|nr:MAG: hypothetical protein A2648_00595 [Candidatus Lloydbacteria bacterium RIFCSPHIGHO2_01_FULL_41_20]